MSSIPKAMDVDQSEYVTDMVRTTSPEYQEFWQDINRLYTARLYHQLTLKLLDIKKDPNFSKKHNLSEMYDKLIVQIEHKINSLSLVEIGLEVADQKLTQDKQSALDFLEMLKKKVSRDTEATILCNSAIGMILLMEAGRKEYPEAREVIESTQTILDEVDGVTSVHHRFYHMSSQYYRLLSKHNEYYREALRYLGCVDLGKLNEEEKRTWAFSIGLAALLGDEVYNFGELLLHPVVQALEANPDHEWMFRLLQAFNIGDLEAFAQLQPKWKTVADLAAAEHDLRRKITLLCLMEMAFRRPANQRTLTFAEIAAATQLPESEVELLVMKALSRGLVRGSIDQVTDHVQITWVRPRVLDRKQIGVMQEKLKLWKESVTSMKDLVKDHAQDIIA